MGTAVELRGVYAAYAGADRPAIEDVGLRISEREFAAIIGPNGAGKTTILEVVLGFLPYQAGSVRVFGEEVREKGHLLRRMIGYLPQDLFFPPDTPYLTLDVVLFGRFGRLRPWQRLPRGDRDAALAALEAFGLLGKARWPVGHLSGGEQRKALLARAMAKGARLLLLDEPLASLDPGARGDLARAILRLRAEGLTIVAVLHEEDLLVEADRTFLVQGGRVEEMPTPADLRETWKSLKRCGPSSSPAS